MRNSPPQKHRASVGQTGRLIKGPIPSEPRPSLGWVSAAYSQLYQCERASSKAESRRNVLTTTFCSTPERAHMLQPTDSTGCFRILRVPSPGHEDYRPKSRLCRLQGSSIDNAGRSGVVVEEFSTAPARACMMPAVVTTYNGRARSSPMSI